MYFHNFIITPLGNGRGPSFEQTWIPFIQGCFVPSLVEIGSVVLEKKIFEFCKCIFTISLLSPLGEGWGPSFEQTWIPFTQGYVVPSLVKIGPVVLEKKIFNSCQFIFINSRLSPLWEGRGPSFEQTWIPFTHGQGCFVPSLVETGPVVLEKKMGIWSLQTDRRMDMRTGDGQQAIRKAPLPSVYSLKKRINIDEHFWNVNRCQDDFIVI